MEALMKGDIVVVNFPFSDLSQTIRRPAFVAATLSGDDCILCQITSKHRTDSFTVFLNDTDFEQGGLHRESFIRSNKLFTIDTSKVLYRIGKLKEEKIKETQRSIINIFATEPS
jgi:mRNA interferase MazF